MRGKFLFVGDEKFLVRGVTYGTFRPDPSGTAYSNSEQVERDLAQMAANHVNTVRLYDVPPTWLLDSAERHGLRVMVGLPWEQHVAFLDDTERAQDIEARVRAGVRACARHPAVMCYAVGNEIPASIVRWYGAQRIERYLKRLHAVAKAEDPQALVTYVNYPTTEYLQLPFVDFVCFNVYLEAEERLAAYLARLHNMAGDRPLVMAEIGLDSRRHGERTQAAVLPTHLRTVYASGCAGAFVFAWTDEWHRGGFDVDDWDFGLTDRTRHPKPALTGVREVFAEVPLSSEIDWPGVSVVVCSYNGARTIRDCLEGLRRLEYPRFEVIVVDDGSTDATAAIAGEYGFRLISTPNRGLSSARNTGIQAASGEIVAFIDDDAFPDPHWLTYLATAFARGDFAGVGGPNLPPAGDGPIAECVANAPGGPMHVLLSDREAEHIPGCNMAFRRASLLEIGGFDPQFRVAGDDVDLCWRLQQRGGRLGFSPAAVVWHHRRNSVHAYWRQQVGYGKAEALLARKWPQKYNSVGHLRWAGRMYGRGLTRSLPWLKARIYQGAWGSAPFQSIDYPSPGPFDFVLLMPEWYLLAATLLGLGGLGLAWRPLLLALLPAAAILTMLVALAVLSAARGSFPSARRSPLTGLECIALTTCLHLMQPIARLSGRLRFGFTRRQRRPRGRLVWPWPRTLAMWSEDWQPATRRLRAIELVLQRAGARVVRGGDYDHWDLEVQGGILGGARLRMAIEEHGAGRQMVRVRCWPRWSAPGLAATLLWIGLALASSQHAVAWVSLLLTAVALFVIVQLLKECAGAAGLATAAMRVAGKPPRDARGDHLQGADSR
ncbi:MAG TPA: glycosyltransferase [Chloroflexota bacterium]